MPNGSVGSSENFFHNNLSSSQVTSVSLINLINEKNMAIVKYLSSSISLPPSNNESKCVESNTSSQVSYCGGGVSWRAWKASWKAKLNNGKQTSLTRNNKMKWRHIWRKMIMLTSANYGSGVVVAIIWKALIMPSKKRWVEIMWRIIGINDEAIKHVNKTLEKRVNNGNNVYI